MEYESFIKLAEKAVSLGCEIVLYDDRKIVRGGLELIVPGTINYRFYLPKAGELKTRKTDLGERIAFECLSIIEAGYSYIDAEEKRIRQNRLYVPTGYYRKINLPQTFPISSLKCRYCSDKLIELRKQAFSLLIVYIIGR